MKKDKSNPWLTDEDSKQVDFYINSADAIIIERNRTMKILLDIFRYHFEEKKNLNLLDIGCGDGILTKNVQEKYPENIFYLLDGSSVMIEKAKQKFKGDNFTFIRQTFEEYIDLSSDDLKYDFIFSANAIHHLDFLGKSKLYAKLFHELKCGGLFLNIDTVLPSSELSEKWQFNMWTDWINETLYKNNFKDEIGKYDNLPLRYKSAAENKPSALFDQIQLLNRIGFRDVDCFYKYGIFAIFGGTKFHA